MSEPRAGCTGHDWCVAELHIHGCYADLGRCNAPEEHPDPNPFPRLSLFRRKRKRGRE